MKLKTITLDMDPSLHRALKMLAAAEDKGLAEMLHEFLKPLYLKALASYGDLPVNDPRPNGAAAGYE